MERAAIVFSAAILRRARIEEGFLNANLSGYTEYADGVRFGCCPGCVVKQRAVLLCGRYVGVFDSSHIAE